MTLKFRSALALYVAGIFITAAIGKTTCPKDRQCGDSLKCMPNEFCQISLPRCPPPEGNATASPWCFPQFECKKIECPPKEPVPALILCIDGYEPKLIQLPKCKYPITSCVPRNCGKN